MANNGDNKGVVGGNNTRENQTGLIQDRSAEENKAEQSTKNKTQTSVFSRERSGALNVESHV